MNSNMVKEASANKIISRSVKELTKNLSNSGVKIKGGVDGAVKQVTKTDFGLAGMAGGAIKEGAKTVGKKVNKALPKSAQDKVKKVSEKTKPIVNKANNARKKFDETIADIDMKGGAIGHKIAPGKTKDLFVQKKKFEIEPPKGKEGNKFYMEHKVNSMSEPLKKARNVAVPIAGGMYFNDKLEKMKYNPANNEQNDKKATESREQVIDKVAHIIQNDNRAYNYSSKVEIGEKLKHMTKLASDASNMLKQASENQDIMLEKIASLTETNTSLMDENLQLKMQLDNMIRSEKSTKLAEDMLDKGLIKKASFEDKVEEIKTMEDSAFDILHNIVENMVIQKTASEQGVDTLMYMSGDSSSKSEKKTMLDSFL